MPYAVTHILFAIILTELVRDYFIKDKKKFPLHYILIAGIGGLLPDLDFLFDIINAVTTGVLTKIHPSFTHSVLWVPILLLISFAVFFIERKKGMKWEKGFTRHHLRISGILFMITLGVATHLILDGLLVHNVRIGFFTPPVGLQLFPQGELGLMFMAGMDAIILVLWLIHMELKHKISNFI